MFPVICAVLSGGFYLRFDIGFLSSESGGLFGTNPKRPGTSMVNLSLFNYNEEGIIDQFRCISIRIMVLVNQDLLYDEESLSLFEKLESAYSLIINLFI